MLNCDVHACTYTDDCQHVTRSAFSVGKISRSCSRTARILVDHPEACQHKKCRNFFNAKSPQLFCKNWELILLILYFVFIVVNSYYMVFVILIYENNVTVLILFEYYYSKKHRFLFNIFFPNLPRCYLEACEMVSPMVTDELMMVDRRLR